MPVKTMAPIKMTNDQCGQKCREPRTLCPSCRNVERCTHTEFSQKVKSKPPNDPAIPLGSIYLKELETGSQQDCHALMFSEALFPEAMRWKHSDACCWWVYRHRQSPWCSPKRQKCCLRPWTVNLKHMMLHTGTSAAQCHLHRASRAPDPWVGSHCVRAQCPLQNTTHGKLPWLTRVKGDVSHYWFFTRFLKKWKHETNPESAISIFCP